jgi:hypothetical protein
MGESLITEVRLSRPADARRLGPEVAQLVGALQRAPTFASSARGLRQVAHRLALGDLELDGALAKIPDLPGHLT